MNSNRSIRGGPNLAGRTSPNIPNSRSDHLINRSSSPPLSIASSRSSLLRQPDHGKNENPMKTFTDADINFFKAAFEKCADTPKRLRITNHVKFCQALSYVGYDLTQSTIDQRWLRNERDINFSRFQRILMEEQPIDERALGEAFETLYGKDRKENGSAIQFDRFRTDLLEKGDCLTTEEFTRMRLLLGTEDGKVDFRKLAKTIGENKVDCRQKILREEKEQKKDDLKPTPLLSRGPKSTSNRDMTTSNNNVYASIDPSPQKLTIPQSLSPLQIKGAFFCECKDSPSDALYFSISYSFDIKRSSPTWITLEPKVSSYHKNASYKNLDVRILLFEITRQNQRRLIHMSTQRSSNKSVLHVNELAQGSYEIVPITFGGVLRAVPQNRTARTPVKKLREIKSGNQPVMSKDYREALEYVFDLFDLDDNKQLDRQEYNLWTLRTAGEEINDDDWLSIRETVALDIDENISKSKFLQLNNMEVQESGTTENDLWIGLKSVGFNQALEFDMMCPYSLTVHTNQSNMRLKPTGYVELQEITKPLTKFIQQKSDKIKLNDLSIQCYQYQDGYGSILFAQNEGVESARVTIQVKNTTNIASNLPDDTPTPHMTIIRRGSTQILWCAHQLDSTKLMKLEAMVQAK